MTQDIRRRFRRTPQPKYPQFRIYIVIRHRYPNGILEPGAQRGAEPQEVLAQKFWDGFDRYSDSAERRQYVSTGELNIESLRNLERIFKDEFINQLTNRIGITTNDVNSLVIRIVDVHYGSMTLVTAMWGLNSIIKAYGGDGTAQIIREAIKSSFENLPFSIDDTYLQDIGIDVHGLENAELRVAESSKQHSKAKLKASTLTETAKTLSVPVALCAILLAIFIPQFSTVHSVNVQESKDLREQSGKLLQSQTEYIGRLQDALLRKEPTTKP